MDYSIIEKYFVSAFSQMDSWFLNETIDKIIYNKL